MKTADLKTAFRPYVYPYAGSGFMAGTEDEDVIERNAQICADIAVQYAAQFAPKWMSVEKHGLPESKFNCIFYSNDLRNPCDMVAGIYFPDKGFMSGGQKWVNVTHYMAMPSKPTTKNSLT